MMNKAVSKAASKLRKESPTKSTSNSMVKSKPQPNLPKKNKATPPKADKKLTSSTGGKNPAERKSLPKEKPVKPYPAASKMKAKPSSAAVTTPHASNETSKSKPKSPKNQSTPSKGQTKALSKSSSEKASLEGSQTKSPTDNKSKQSSPELEKKAPKSGLAQSDSKPPKKSALSAHSTSTFEVKTVSKDEDEDEVLLGPDGRPYCKVKDCDQPATIDGYCRYHYILLWKKIQTRRKILSDGKLERYVEELTARYPDRYLEVIRKDLSSEKAFLAVMSEYELDDSSPDESYDFDDNQNIEEMKNFQESDFDESEF